MKYAFVSLSIFVIWLAIIIMAFSVPAANLVLLHQLAIVATIILFVIGFKGR